MTTKAMVPKLRFKDDDGREFPEWVETALQSICEINPKTAQLPETFVYVDLESVEKGALLKQTVIAKKNAPSRAQRVLKNEDVLFQMVRPYQGNNLFFNESGSFVASTGYAQIRTSEDPRFLYHYLHLESFTAEVMNRCTGTSYPAINSSDLGSIEISLPSKQEQTKIANFLTAVDDKVSQLTKKHELLTLYKKGVMQKIFSQELRFKDDEGREFAEWEERRLGEIAKFHRGSQLAKADLITNGDFPCIHYGQLFTIYSEVIDIVRSKTNIDNGFLSKFGDILMPSSDVTPQGLAKASSLLQTGVVLGGDINVIRLSHGHSSVMLSYLLNYEKKQIIGLVSGTTVKHIYTKDLNEIILRLPTSNQEQTKIANFLTAIDGKITNVKSQLEAAKEYKQGLLQQMFV